LKHEEQDEEFNLAGLVQLIERLDGRLQTRSRLNLLLRAVCVTQTRDNASDYKNSRPDKNGRQVRFCVSAQLASVARQKVLVHAFRTKRAMIAACAVFIIGRATAAVVVC